MLASEKKGAYPVFKGGEKSDLERNRRRGGGVENFTGGAGSTLLRTNG